MTYQPLPPILDRKSFFPSRRRVAILLWLFSICTCLLFPVQSLAKGHTTIIFPEQTGPYRKVFDAILQGIEDATEGTVRRYSLKEDFNFEDLQQEITDNCTDGIISLGKKAALASKKLSGEQPVVVGGLSIVPNGISGVSLAADPTVVFTRLKKLNPEIKRIFVVYSEKHNGWLIKPARLIASELGIQLVAYRARDLREAMHHYRTLITDSHGNTDAIWLPLDPVTVNDDVVLPLLLQAAWDKNLAIVSNRPGHAKRGALFAFYPDNYGLGQQLAKLLQRLKKTPQQSRVEPLRELQIASNLRTAAHLGMDFTQLQLEEFTLTFPSR